MAKVLTAPKGISSTSVIDVPDAWNADWFRRFIRTQISQADVRNANAGPGIIITGNPVTPATLSVNTDVQALFHQPYVLATAPTGIGSTFDSYRLLVPQNGVLTVADAGAKSNITVGVASNGIGNAQFRQGGAHSVVGNPTNTVGNVTDIASSATGDVLWNNGTGTLSFGPLTSLGTVTTGVWDATPVAAPFGGTGQNTYSVGDLLYASATNALARLADVASGSFLRSGGVGVAPGWSATVYPNSATAGDILYASGANTYANLADVAAGSYLRSGGVGAAPVWSTTTLPNAAALGDLMYASAANTYSDLAGNTSATKKFLTQTGTGSASAAPGWNTIAASDLPGSFNGFANPTANVGLAVVNGIAATAMRSDAAPALDQTIAPTWQSNHRFTPASGVAIAITGVAAAAGISVAQGTGAAAAGLVITTTSNSGNGSIQITGGTGVFAGISLAGNGATPGTNDFVLFQNTNSDAFITARSAVAMHFQINGTDRILLDSSGNTTIKGNIGFNSTAPIAKPTVTGSKAANAALTSLLTALASYGLITDSST